MNNTVNFIKLGVLKLILRSDKFGVSENIIFEKCVEWSEYQTSLKVSKNINNEEKSVDNDITDDDDIDITQKTPEKHNHENTEKNIKDAFNLIKYDIRFPIMDGEYFHAKVIDSSLLDSSECLDILRYMQFGYKCNDIKTKVEKIWNCKPRDRYTTNMRSRITQAQFASLCGFLPQMYQKYKWKLLFRASEHKFQASKFHQYCDNKSPTVTIVKPRDCTNIFGGFTESVWSSQTSYSTDADAFLFVLRKDQQQGFNSSSSNAQKFCVKSGKSSVYGNKAYGPTFGGGHDLRLSDRCDVSISDSNILCYDGLNNSELAANSNFYVEDYEVWQLISQDGLDADTFCCLN